jgi:hypothetical protein
MKNIPIGEDTRPKDRVKLGLSPSANVKWIDATPKKKAVINDNKRDVATSFNRPKKTLQEKHQKLLNAYLAGGGIIQKIPFGHMKDRHMMTPTEKNQMYWRKIKADKPPQKG